MEYWPLLDIREALADCERNLAEMTAAVETLLAEADGHYPPDAAHLLATFAQVQALLAEAITPAIQAAIDAEHAKYEEEMARWEASQG